MINYRADVDVRLKAMAHPARRAMIRHSLSDERAASELAALTGLSRPAASQHLAMLLEAGLLNVRTEGRNRWYASDADALRSIRDELADFWTPRLDALRRLAERQEGAQRGR